MEGLLFRLELELQLLLFKEPGVAAILSHELGMGAGFGADAVLQEEDPVRGLDRADPVGNENGGLARCLWV